MTRIGGSPERAGLRRGSFLPALSAAILALAGLLAPATAPAARAASDGLFLTTAATYTIAPASRVVRVVLDVTARNDKPNTTSAAILTRYFYDGARLAIQAEATNVRATSGGTPVTATTTPRTGFAILEVRFRSSLFYHQSTAVRVTFDLPGGAPRSKSDIRVGTAFATFVAWAFGDSGSIRVVVPSGFEAETTGSDAARSTSGGTTIFRATDITAIGAWYLVVTADRKSALTSDRIDLAGGEHLVVRAWPEDAQWKRQVSELLTRGLPELVAQTGLDWPVAGDLSVFEVHTPLLEGYGGVFFVGQNRIEISEDLDDLTILHEASHAWFNSNLFVGRWINEGLADTYAAKSLDGIGIGPFAPNPVSPTDAVAVRLDDWVHPARITDMKTEARERYGYDAAWTVIRTLVNEVGDPGMRQVLAAAAKHQIAYVGAGPAETVGGSNDWRRFLDLIDEIGDSTTADGVFRRWVVTDAEAEVLDKRAAARTAYAQLVRAGTDWRPPFFVRGPLSDWDFVTASKRILAASAVLASRDQVASLAARLGIEPPPALRTAYVNARDSLDGAVHEADSELAAVQALAVADRAVAAPRAPLVNLGLIGEQPEPLLAAARAAFSTGAADAAGRATAVTDLIDGSVGVGRARLFALIAIVPVLLVLSIVGVVMARRRRRQRRRLGPLVASESLTVEPADPAPYATLADQSSGPPQAAGPDPTASRPPDTGDDS